MRTCEFCVRVKTRGLCHHCEKPICSACNVYGEAGENAPLQLPFGSRVCATCMRQYRRAHGLTKGEVRGLLKFFRNR